MPGRVRYGVVPAVLVVLLVVSGCRGGNDSVSPTAATPTAPVPAPAPAPAPAPVPSPNPGTLDVCGAIGDDTRDDVQDHQRSSVLAGRVVRRQHPAT